MKPTINIAFPALLLWLMPLTSYAQPYPIPGAAQQPAWVFPIWFENANGDKDTLYLGYDSTATQIIIIPPDTFDARFGEELIAINGNIFNAYFMGFHPTNDSALKVLVIPDISGLFVVIEATQGWLPIKMLWDVSLFRSDSLPFPDSSPSPRAEGLIWMNGIAVPEPHDDLGCSSFGDNPILVTDTFKWPSPGFPACVRRDSVVFTELYYLAFEVRPWSGRWVSVEDVEHTNPTVTVFPNPFFDYASLHITGPNLNSGQYTMQVYDMHGRQVRQTEFTGPTMLLERNGLPAGIYFYVLTDSGRSTITGKFIIH